MLPSYQSVPNLDTLDEKVSAQQQQQHKFLPLKDESTTSDFVSSQRKPRYRALGLALLAVVLIASVPYVGNDPNEKPKREPKPSYQSEFVSPFPPRLNDNNELFTGPGGAEHLADTIDQVFGSDATKGRHGGGDDKLDLQMGQDILGFNAWSDKGREILSKPPLVLDEETGAFVINKPLGDQNPGDVNSLIRPVPPRKPQALDTSSNLNNQCNGPANYKWDGPEKITVDLEKFQRFYMLVKSGYIKAEITFKENDADAEDDDIVIRSDIRFVEPELNKEIEFSEHQNETRNAFVLRLSTPSWDKTGRGRSNCIFANLDVILPKNKHALQLLGAGVVVGKVDLARLPENIHIDHLVGWAVDGALHIKAAPDVQRATLAVSNGALFAHRLAVAGALSSKVVNGRHELQVTPTSEDFSLKASNVNGAVKVSVSEKYSGSFRLFTINGKTSVVGKDLNFRRKSTMLTEGNHGDGKQSIDLHTANGGVFLAFEDRED